MNRFKTAIAAWTLALAWTTATYADEENTMSQLEIDTSTKAMECIELAENLSDDGLACLRLLAGEEKFWELVEAEMAMQTEIYSNAAEKIFNEFSNEFKRYWLNLTKDDIEAWVKKHINDIKWLLGWATEKEQQTLFENMLRSEFTLALEEIKKAFEGEVH